MVAKHIAKIAGNEFQFKLLDLQGTSTHCWGNGGGFSTFYSKFAFPLYLSFHCKIFPRCVNENHAIAWSFGLASDILAILQGKILISL